MVRIKFAKHYPEDGPLEGHKAARRMCGRRLAPAKNRGEPPVNITSHPPGFDPRDAAQNPPDLSGLYGTKRTKQPKESKQQKKQTTSLGGDSGATRTKRKRDQGNEESADFVLRRSSRQRRSHTEPSGGTQTGPAVAASLPVPSQTNLDDDLNTPQLDHATSQQAPPPVLPSDFPSLPSAAETLASPPRPSSSPLGPSAPASTPPSSSASPAPSSSPLANSPSPSSAGLTNSATPTSATTRTTRTIGGTRSPRTSSSNTGADPTDINVTNTNLAGINSTGTNPMTGPVPAPAPAEAQQPRLATPRTRGNGNTLTTPGKILPFMNYARPDAKLMRGLPWTEEEDLEWLRLRKEGVTFQKILDDGTFRERHPGLTLHGLQSRSGRLSACRKQWEAAQGAQVGDAVPEESGQTTATGQEEEGAAPATGMMAGQAAGNSAGEVAEQAD